MHIIYLYENATLCNVVPCTMSIHNESFKTKYISHKKLSNKLLDFSKIKKNSFLPIKNSLKDSQVFVLPQTTDAHILIRAPTIRTANTVVHHKGRNAFSQNWKQREQLLLHYIEHRSQRCEITVFKVSMAVYSGNGSFTSIPNLTLLEVSEFSSARSQGIMSTVPLPKSNYIPI